MEEGAFSSSGDLTRPEKERYRPKILAALLGTAAESLFATAFPGNCRFCDSPLLHASRVPVCNSCLETIRGLRSDQRTCQVCGERLLRPADHSETTAANPVCAACRTLEPPFISAIAYGDYDGALRDLIHLLKYEGVRPASAVLGRMLGEIIAGFTPKFGPEAPVVIPVPLHARKLRERGFNQSELIARAALRSCGLRLAVNTSVLVRRRETGTQTGLTRQQRQQNIRGAFAVINPEEITGRDVLLVDDVFTTGTTVSECARVLKLAGARNVFVATVARVPAPDRAGIPPAFEEGGDEEATKPMVRAAHA